MDRSALANPNPVECGPVDRPVRQLRGDRRLADAILVLRITAQPLPRAVLRRPSPRYAEIWRLMWARVRRCSGLRVSRPEEPPATSILVRRRNLPSWRSYGGANELDTQAIASASAVGRAPCQAIFRPPDSSTIPLPTQSEHEPTGHSSDHHNDCGRTR